MLRDKETARIVGEMLRLLLEGPLPKGELRERIAPENDGPYADAVGALRVLGLAIAENGTVSPTDTGRYLASRPDELSAAELVEALRAHRQSGQPGLRNDRGERLMSGLSRRIEEVPNRTTMTLYGIRRNAQRLRAESGSGAWRFGLTIYIAAIDKEFERRALGTPNDDWFPWPDTDAPGGDGSVNVVQFTPEGMLSTMGYRVGMQNGVPQTVRRQVLKQVFEGALPPLFDPAYMRKWGRGGTAVRLRTLAYTIAQFAKNLKRRHDDRIAIVTGTFAANIAAKDIEHEFDALTHFPDRRANART